LAHRFVSGVAFLGSEQCAQRKIGCPNQANCNDKCCRNFESVSNGRYDFGVRGFRHESHHPSLLRGKRMIEAARAYRLRELRETLGGNLRSEIEYGDERIQIA
jgi:hypothetical protein